MLNTKYKTNVSLNDNPEAVFLYLTSFNIIIKCSNVQIYYIAILIDILLLHYNPSDFSLLHQFL